MAIILHTKAGAVRLKWRTLDKAGDTQQYKGYELRESSGGVFFAYKNGKVISGISGDLQDVKHTIDYIMGDRSDRPGDSARDDARVLLHVHSGDSVRTRALVRDCGGVMDCGCGGAQARDAAYHTCQECEANFTAAQCANGKLPDHKFLGKPCPGSGTPVPATKAKDAGDVRVIFNKLLNGWYIVRGPAQTPLGGKFATKEEAEAHLNRSRDMVAA